ncbi:MAG: right-handed parallel beta-helix repeat-containing protein [Thermoguttaceae bacterium]|nr:right-handed parallel beta-helix repeat-containing protein [Thermoguttaceae bacterium]
MKRRLFRQLLTPSLVAAFAWISFAVAQGAALKTFYVAPDGNDAWSGGSAEASGSDGPFATLERARDAVREFKKTLNADASGEIVVSVASGAYVLDRPFELTDDDSGTASVTVRWESNVDSPASLVGGRYLTGAKKLDDASILARLKEDVRDKILVFDLDANGVSELGTPEKGPELFFRGESTRLARYPNEGFINVAELVHDGTVEIESHGIKGIKEGKFFFADDEPATWGDESEVWVDGYWFWDWSNQKQKVVSIDAAAKQMTLAEPWHHYGYRVGQWFYAFNVLRELDAPGEYYIDREKKTLYFYPPGESWNDGDFFLTQATSLLRLDGVSNVAWSGFDMFGAVGTGIVGSKCRDVALADLNVFNCGWDGIVVEGTRCSVSGCELWNLGSGGVTTNGGDRNALIPSENLVVENYIHNYGRVRRMYATGITINDVGARIAHNLIEDAPHMGMYFSGNDITIEYNEIANVCQESNDAGAIYAGRNWTMRGNVLRGNYMHDITGFEGRGCVGMYLDDMFSSASMEGNLYVNVTRASFIGGGRDCRIVDNVYIDCKPALHIDARALGWCHDHADEWIQEAREKGTMSGIKYNEPPYSTRYPELASIFDEGKTPKAPEGNVISGNICVGGSWDVNNQGQWQGDTVEEAARPYLTFGDNYVADEGADPGFVDAAHGDYRLKPDSELVAKGYKSLPDEPMGLTSERMRAKAEAVRAKKTK